MMSRFGDEFLSMTIPFEKGREIEVRLLRFASYFHSGLGISEDESKDSMQSQ